jgi:hypothetical protein
MTNLNSIRFYLSERFRLRFEGVGLDDISEERNDANVGSLADSSAVMDKLASTEAGLAQEKDRSLQGGVTRTLNGDEIEDEFDQDAINYQILLGKIDQLLDRLKLDA